MTEGHPLYHFTCTARLPWIVATKHLKPDAYQIGHFPNHDFVWATTSPHGDRTASAMQGYRKRVTALVRLTLFAEDFEPWPGITARFPQWTIEHVRDLEAAARRIGETNIEGWRARTTPLPLSRVVCAEAKTCTGRWQAIELVSVHTRNDPSLRGIVLNDHVYASSQHVRAGQPTAYTAVRIPISDWGAASGA
jgi:hypothetical protein